MPIDANIALGVRPVEPVNMLGQMGQMMQMRQMQQEYQDTNAMRDLAAQHGGDISNPKFLNAAGALNPKYAAALRKEVAATEGTQLKTSADRAQALSGGFAWLAKNPSMDNAANIVASWQSQGLIPDRVAQHYMATFSADPSKIAFNANLGANAAISSKDQMTDATSRANAATGAAPGHRQASIVEQRFAQEQADRAEADRLAGRPSTPLVAPMTGGGGGGGGGGGSPFSLPMTGGGAPSTGGGVTNALPAILGAAPAAPASTNMLIPGAQAPATAPVTPVAPAVAPTVAPVTAAAPVRDANTRIQDISAEIERLRPYMGNPKVALNVQQLATERTQLIAAAKQEAPTLTRIDDPTTPGQRLEINAREYKGGGLGSPGVLGVARTDKLTPQQTVKLKAEIGKDFKAVERTIAETDALLESIDAVRNSNLERVAGPIDARTFTMTNEGKLAETRFENLKGKVTAIAKTAATMTGAIGSIANQEWQILANQIAVLDLKNGKEPSLEQIDQLERQAMSIANRMRDGFSRQYGEYLDELGPQYREIPNVTYTPGSAGYTPTGKKTPARNSATPANTGNIATNPTIDALLNKYK